MIAGPSLVKRRLPILKPPTDPRSRSARARASATVSTSRATRSCSMSVSAQRARPLRGQGGSLLSGRIVDGSYQIGHAGDAVAAPVVADAVEQSGPDERVDEVRGADLHGIRPGDHELVGIARVGDAAHADHGNL